MTPRAAVLQARRVVVKVGSSSLTTGAGGIDPDRVSALVDTVAALRAESGLDIWLFGGGRLFASLLAAGLVDRVEVALMPVILGGGIPLAGFDAPRSRLLLTHSDVHPSGIVSLAYDVQPAAG